MYSQVNFFSLKNGIVMTKIKLIKKKMRFNFFGVKNNRVCATF